MAPPRRRYGTIRKQAIITFVEDDYLERLPPSTAAEVYDYIATGADEAVTAGALGDVVADSQLWWGLLESAYAT